MTTSRVLSTIFTAEAGTLLPEVRLLSRATVAIEGQLSPMADALKAAGYEVVPLDDQSLKVAQAVVVQGTDDNFLGIENTLTRAPVINADGMTADQVLAAVEDRALTQQ